MQLDVSQWRWEIREVLSLGIMKHYLRNVQMLRFTLQSNNFLLSTAFESGASLQIKYQQQFGTTRFYHPLEISRETNTIQTCFLHTVCCSRSSLSQQNTTSKRNTRSNKINNFLQLLAGVMSESSAQLRYRTIETN